MIRPARRSRKADSDQLALEVRRGLDQLERAFDYAQDLGSPLWDFAVEIDRLVALGVTVSDLRWLVKRSYVSHAREITAPQDTNRRFEAPEGNLAFAKNTCFVLTNAGLAILGREASPANPTVELPVVVSRNDYVGAAEVGALGRVAPLVDSQVDLPREMPVAPDRAATILNWDGDTRTFLVGEYLVKRFRVPSPNQEAVLEAFQEEGWPASIDDPLSPVANYEPKRRLRDTIKCLNLNQTTRLIRFHGDGTGQRVLWELVHDSASPANSSPTNSAKSQFLYRAA